MGKVVINFSFVWCKIISAPSAVYNLLYDTLKYRPEGYYFSPKYQNGIWDGYCRLYKHASKKFRTGLLPRVVDILKSNNYEIEILNFPNHAISEISKVDFKDANDNVVTLRHYQQEATLTAIRKRFGIIQAPPRSGKTLIAVSIIYHFNQFPVVFLVRSRDLAYQTLRVFEKNFKDKQIGFICDGECKIGDINVVTVQSAYSAYNKKYKEKGLYEEKEVVDKEGVRNLLIKTKTLFLDEVHHLQSSTTGFIYDRCINTVMKIGLSATPFSDKPDSILVEERTGPVIYKITYSSLIEEGYLMTPYIYMYKLPSIKVDGNYRAVYTKAVIQNPFLTHLVRNLAKQLNALGKSVVVQTEFIQHTKDLAKFLECEYLVGSDSTEKRQDVLKRLQNKEILLLVSTLFEEGLDVPSLDYTINMVGGLSNIATFQRMRSITKHESKTTVGIIDFIHQCKYLSQHSQKRLSLYKSEPAFVVEIRDVSNLTLEDIENED